MKMYSTAAVSIALGLSEEAIKAKLGSCKNGVSLSQILDLDNDAKMKRYNEDADKIRKLLEGVKALES